MSTQREIKFRCWHPGHVGRVRVPASMFYDTWSGECLKFLKEGQPVVVMQYTGLRDQDGNEIWEGDIVLHKRGDHNRTGRISMREGEWVVDYFKSGASSLRSQYPILKVIGNVHEHPELIP